VDGLSCAALSLKKEKKEKKKMKKRRHMTRSL